MIFVAVGTQKFQLNRLLREIDELVKRGEISEEVFAQTGYSEYEPRNYNYKPFLDRDEFVKAIVESNLLITHSGVGTIITGLKNNKPVIVFPRKVEFYEHVDNHQMEIAEAFAEKNYVLLCRDTQELARVIQEAYVHSFDIYISGKSKIVKRIARFFEKM